MPRRPHTHVLWLQKWARGKFVEWLPVGKGRIDIDANGVAAAHNYQDLISIGGTNGYTCLLPIGVTPPDPAITDPRRPSEVLDNEENQ